MYKKNYCVINLSCDTSYINQPVACCGAMWVGGWLHKFSQHNESEAGMRGEVCRLQEAEFVRYVCSNRGALDGIYTHCRGFTCT